MVKILKTYDRRGESLWKYNVTDSSELISLEYVEKRQLCCSFQDVFEYEYIRGLLTLLKDGLVGWEYPILEKGVTPHIKITSNNKYIILSLRKLDGCQSTILSLLNGWRTALVSECRGFSIEFRCYR